MDGLLNLTTPAPLALDTLAVNLLLSIALSSAVAWFYSRFGRSLSNRTGFARNLPPLALTTVLIISIIKSSLALSLGLVGALSIVRFRTAIKEPEELVYLFLAIAIGLGLGADQRFATILALLIILAFFFVRSYFDPRWHRNRIFFNIVVPEGASAFSEINETLLKLAQSADLRRLDSTADSMQVTYLIELADDQALTALMDKLRAKIPACEFSFVDQDNTLGG